MRALRRARTFMGAPMFVALVLLGSVSCRASAQRASQGASPDSALARARRLVNEGNAAAGRALVDSVLSTATEGTAAYAEALYWRASLAEASDRARRDYLRLTVEYATSPRAADALLRLAQMDFGRGERAAARRQLERLAFEYGTGPTAAQGAYWMGRVLLEEGAVLEACTSLATARSKVGKGDVELTGQIAYYAQPCARAQADAASRARVDSATRADSIERSGIAARADSIAAAARAKPVKTPVSAKGPPAAKGPAWSAQVAAYTTRADAERLASRLSARGYDARVTEAKPYRVRIGRFATRAGAVAVVEKLRLAKTQAIVVEAERP